MIGKLGIAAYAAAFFAMASSCNRTRAMESRPDSLTGVSYSGKKYYIGWGAAGGGDPEEMHNEVKYDVLHTHDVFTTARGGQYEGKRLIDGLGRASAVKQAWAEYKGRMTSQDMYVQYSSGHGSETGLGVGLSYSEMAEYALSLPAKEVVVFTMACHSGGLVNEIRRRQAEWQGRAAEGRTLLVMASSSQAELSKTGPGTDASESAGVEGSAGSAFGHALWKSLAGNADGYLDGVKDGLISLGELVAYSTDRTIQIGGHSPVYAGTFNPAVVMNSVAGGTPTTYGTGTDHMTDDQIRQSVRRLDDSLVRLSAQEQDQIVSNAPQPRAGEEIFVALMSLGQGQQGLFYASGAPGTQQMEACVGLQGNDCRQGVPGYIAFTKSGDLNGRPVFKASNLANLSGGLRLGFNSRNGQSITATRVVELRLRSNSTTPPPGGGVGSGSGSINGSALRIGELSLTVPNGWNLVQEASISDTQLFTLGGQTGEFVSVYSKRGPAGNLRSNFANSGAQVVQDAHPEQIGSRQWQRLESRKASQSRAADFKGKTYFVSAFWTEFNGTTYYGYARSESAEGAKRAVDNLLATANN